MGRAQPPQTAKYGHAGPQRSAPPPYLPSDAPLCSELVRQAFNAPVVSLPAERWINDTRLDRCKNIHGSVCFFGGHSLNVEKLEVNCRRIGGGRKIDFSEKPSSLGDFERFCFSPRHG